MKSVNFKRFTWTLAVLLMTALACQGTTLGGSNSGPGSSSNGAGTSSGAGLSSNAPASLPSSRLDQAGDVDSSSMATAKSVSGGDVFVKGLYERPFNANTMDTYFPYIDIVGTQGFKDDTWGYITITLAGNDNNGKLSAQYAAELDVNEDGRGDWLIRASNPSSTNWTTQGVQAWKDANGDVGGVIPMVADNNPAGGDGYETLVFDEGKGSLTDGAWARVDPNDPKTVQIAFKLSMVGNPASFTMGAWAGANIDPSKFDHNDHMTHIQAGDPNPGYGVYPIKELAEIDNTCRLAIGFVPDPNKPVPGVCRTITPGGSCTEPASCSKAAGNCVWYGPPQCYCQCLQ